jgi:hypothetical protein
LLKVVPDRTACRLDGPDRVSLDGRPVDEPIETPADDQDEHHQGPHAQVSASPPWPARGGLFHGSPVALRGVDLDLEACIVTGYGWERKATQG